MASDKLSRQQVDFVLRRAAEIDTSTSQARARRRDDPDRARGDAPRRGGGAAARRGGPGADRDEARRRARARGGRADAHAGREPDRRQPRGPRAGRAGAARRRPVPARPAHDRAAPPRRPHRVGAGAGDLARARALAGFFEALRLRPGDPRRDHRGRGGGEPHRGHLPDRPVGDAARAPDAHGAALGDGVRDPGPGRVGDLPRLRAARRDRARQRRRRGGRDLRARAAALSREPQPRRARARTVPGSAGAAPPPAPAGHAPSMPTLDEE